MTEYSIGEGRTSGNQRQPEAVGATIGGRYRIMRTIGIGGMGIVYQCQDEKLCREVAVKRLVGGADAAIAERFRREAMAIAGLGHIAIVKLHDFDTDAGGPYLVMELLQGSDLGALVAKKGPLSPSQLRQVAVQVAEGLQYAHDRKVVHRDIKPSNLFLGDDGRVRILDFGLARLTAASSNVNLSIPGGGLGTAHFVAPEQERDARLADSRSDQYSLGMTLYVLATGKRPRVIKPAEVPTELRSVVLKMIEEDPEKRFTAMNDIVKALANHGESGEAVEFSRHQHESDRTPAGTAPPAVPQVVAHGYGGQVFTSARLGPSDRQDDPVKLAALTPSSDLRILSGFLGLFGGYAGLHRFVMDDWAGGAIRCGISLVAVLLLLDSSGTGSALALLLLAVGPVEGFIYLSKSDAEFRQTYQIGRRQWL